MNDQADAVFVGHVYQEGHSGEKNDCPICTGDSPRTNPRFWPPAAMLVLEWLSDREGDYPNACGHLAAEWAETMMEVER